MKISLNLLTMGRGQTVIRSLRHNFENCGYFAENCPIKEVVWTDNASSKEDLELIASELSHLQGLYGFDVVATTYNENRGVSVGYNTCAVLSTGTHILISGCDRLMPDNWLKEMVTVIAQRDVSVVSMYSQPIEKLPERVRGDKFFLGDLELVPCLPFGARLFTKELKLEAGYLNTGFGKYGFEDCAWAETVLRVNKEKGWESLAIINRVAEHLGTEGVKDFKEGGDEKAYHEFKQREVNDPKKQELMKELREANWPVFNPYAPN